MKPEPVFQQPSQSFDESLETDSDAAPGKGGNKGATAKRRRRIRNAKQQELNRLAQQRYRWVGMHTGYVLWQPYCGCMDHHAAKHGRVVVIILLLPQYALLWHMQQQ